MKNIGLLGGGQLARMLALKAAALGLRPFVLSPSPDDPAAQVTSFWKKGNPHNPSDLLSFFKQVDTVTFESEFVSASLIESTLKKLKKPPHVAPSLKNLSLIQDRLSQKNLLKKYKLKTADFLSLPSQKNTKQLQDLLQKWSSFVLKTRMGGYDGYGTFIIKNSQSLKNKRPSTSYIAEKFIPFKRELALTVIRSKEQTSFFPLVETFQKEGRCLWVKGPVTHKKLEALKKQISFFLKKIHYQGAITFELFDQGTELLINELAPRVHNSAHHSLNSLTEDQFTLHLKAICNLPFQTPVPLKKGFAMLNLLGEGSKKTYWKLPKDVHLHWYGKKQSRKGRKMGHLNALASDSKQALKKLLKARKMFKI